MPITVMAEAENQAATNKAEAINVLAKADADAATTRAAGVKSLGQAEAEVAALKAEARNKLSLGDGRLRSHAGAHQHHPERAGRGGQADREDLRHPDLRHRQPARPRRRQRRHEWPMATVSASATALPAQLLSVSAFKPIIDKILAEGGFAAGPDALTSLTNALAAQQLASSRRTARYGGCRRRGDAARDHLRYGQGDARSQIVNQAGGLIRRSN